MSLTKQDLIKIFLALSLLVHVIASALGVPLPDCVTTLPL